MATLGLSRLLPKPTQQYTAHKDEASPASLARLEIAEKRAVYLILHHISKRANIRTLLISAAAFGAEVLIVGQPGFEEKSHVPRGLREAFAGGEKWGVVGDGGGEREEGEEEEEEEEEGEGEEEEAAAGDGHADADAHTPQTDTPTTLTDIIDAEAHPGLSIQRFHGSLEMCRDYLHTHNIKVLGIEIGEEAVSVEEACTHPHTHTHHSPSGGPSGGVALLLGNEGTGMSERQAKVCDGFVYIPQYGQGTASLNVAVAGSIVMHRFSLLWAGEGAEAGGTRAEGGRKAGESQTGEEKNATQDGINIQL